MSETTQEAQTPDTPVVQENETAAPAETTQAAEQPAQEAPSNETTAAAPAADETTADTQDNTGAAPSEAPVPEAPAVAAPVAADTPTAPVTETPVVQETQAPAEVPQAPAVTVMADPVPATVEEVQQPAETNDSNLSDFGRLLKHVKAEGTVVEKQLVQRMEAYLDAMAPGKVMSPQSGASYQYELWNILEFAFDKAPREEFNSLWTLLLGFFKEHENGALGPRYVNRFSQHWMQAAIKLTGLQRLINLLMVTARPENRVQGLKTVDIDRTLTDGITPEGRSRILNFYGK